jgi:Prenylcysteine lyase
MPRVSGAEIRQQSQITQIGPRKLRRYQVSYSAEFDNITIATPLQDSGMDLSELGRHWTSNYQYLSYRKSHMTHFTYANGLSPAYFNLPPDSAMPETVFTPPTNSSQRAPDFYRMAFHELSFRDDNQFTKDNLDEVFSDSPVIDVTIARLLGLKNYANGTDIYRTGSIGFIGKLG